MSLKKLNNKIDSTENDNNENDNENDEVESNDDEIIETDNLSDNELDNDDDNEYFEEEENKFINDTELLEDKEETENCYFQYDNLIEEYEDLGPPTKVPDEDRITLNRLTKYEIVRILGARAKQISVGAKTLVKNIEGKSPIEIALYELRNKTIPFKIKRPMPNNTYEIWKIAELNIDLTENDEKSIISSIN